MKCQPNHDDNEDGGHTGVAFCCTPEPRRPQSTIHHCKLFLSHTCSNVQCMCLTLHLSALATTSLVQASLGRLQKTTTKDQRKHQNQARSLTCFIFFIKHHLPNVDKPVEQRHRDLLKVQRCTTPKQSRENNRVPASCSVPRRKTAQTK